MNEEEEEYAYYEYMQYIEQQREEAYHNDQIAYYNNLSEKELIEVINNEDPVNFIGYIENLSENVQIAVVNNFNYKEQISDNVKSYITSEKALELYNKLKSAYEIIK
jgi:hypothetical protein